MVDPDKPGMGRPVSSTMLKALAHPLRVQLVELLSQDGASTASALGRKVGESSGTTSYHLRRLASVGLIEEDPDRGSARDRWWRVVPGGWSLGVELERDQSTRADAEMVVDELMRMRQTRLQTWLRHRDRWPVEWREASVGSIARLTLSPEQSAALVQDLLAVVERYRDAQAPEDAPGTARVVVQTDVFPTGDPPDEGVEPGAEAPSDRTD